MYLVYHQTVYLAEKHQTDTEPVRVDIRAKKKEFSMGVCSCGHIFPIMENADFQFDDVVDYEQVTCPNCKAKFGNLVTRRYSRDTIYPVAGKSIEQVMWDRAVKEYSSAYFNHGCLYRAEAPDADTIIIYKESVNNEGTVSDWFANKVSYQLTIRLHPDVTFQQLLVDGEEVKPTKTAVSKALSDITPGRILNDNHNRMLYLDDLAKEIYFASKVVRTMSLKKIIFALQEYPAISSAYNRGQMLCQARVLADAYNGGFLVAGEKSPLKALGVNRDLAKYLLDGKTDIGGAIHYFKNRTWNNEILSMSVQMMGDVCGKRFDTVLADLFATLTTAERNRLHQYLTHDTEVYQGIEDHGAAWNILKDYRRMCKDMEVSPELCPRSLKLLHDITARNYNICLNEIEKKKFQERVSSEEYQNLQWVHKQWAVVIPNTADDIIEEGAKQSHCVGSYVRYVLDGSYRICFLRHTEDLRKPVLTLTVDAKNQLLYYKGFDNRDATKEERAVLENWVKAKKLTMSQCG